jgi:hypothetical protein
MNLLKKFCDVCIFNGKMSHLTNQLISNATQLLDGIEIIYQAIEQSL